MSDLLKPLDFHESLYQRYRTLQKNGQNYHENQKM